MKRKAQYLFAGNFGKPVYVQGYLTDEQTTGAPLMFEVTRSEPEPRPKPGLYRAADLPGGWMTLLPDPELNPSSDVDRAVLKAALAAGFPIRDRP